MTQELLYENRNLEVLVKEIEHERIKIRDGVYVDFFVQTKKYSPAMLMLDGSFQKSEAYEARFWIEYDFILFTSVERARKEMFQTRYENIAEQAFSLYKRNLPKAKNLLEILEDPKRYLTNNFE